MILYRRARDAIRESQFDEALAALERAEQLRRGDDIAPLRATAFLLNRDFANALRVYDETP